jgi:hypothetical protein
MPSMQLPPFWHGFDAHSSTFTAHVPPLKPAAQAQKYASTATLEFRPDSEHVALCRQGCDAHSSTSVEHSDPLQPAEQLHVNEPTPSIHAPPF